MKRKLTGLLSLSLSALIGGSVMLSACSFLSCESDITGQHFTISYTDYDGKHTEDVRHGFTFDIDVPDRNGYQFLGFYDAEQGGNQITDEYGYSLEKYTYRENITLYPRWQANEYTVVLNYGAANGTVKSLNAVYDQSLPELPANVELEHYNFKGWYTAANCGGVQIADANGLNPIVSVVNSDNFNLSGGYINLFAGFEVKNYEVTLRFNNSKPDEKLTVPYGTSVSELAYKTRADDGKAVFTWADSSSEAYSGTVNGNMTLYALEWANCINFDVDGGVALPPVVARDGATVTLPTPEKDLYKFVQWEKSGVEYTSTVMPAECITLKAKWQAKIVFDENGGSEVSDISKTAGSSITLPAPEREGYIFAGWYTEDGQEYTSTAMPATGIMLKAGWYKAVMDSRVEKVTTSKNVMTEHVQAPTTSFLWYKIALTQYLGSLSKVTVKIDGQFQFAAISYSQVEVSAKPHTNIYSKNMANSSYLLWTKSYDSFSGYYKYKTYEFTATLTVSEDAYLSFYLSNCKTNLAAIKSFYYTVTYPDTSVIY